MNSDNVQDGQSTQTDQPVATKSPIVLPPAIALLADITSYAGSQGAAVRQAVIEQLGNEEVKRRSEAVIVLVNAYREHDKELKKAEAQGTWVFNAAGEKVGDPTYTAEQAKTMKGLKEQIQKISSAFNNFFENSNSGKLLELAKELSSKKG